MSESRTRISELGIYRLLGELIVGSALPPCPMPLRSRSTARCRWTKRRTATSKNLQQSCAGLKRTSRTCFAVDFGTR